MAHTELIVKRKYSLLISKYLGLKMHTALFNRLRNYSLYLKKLFLSIMIVIKVCVLFRVDLGHRGNREILQVL